MTRFASVPRPISALHPIQEFYREEFLKHRRCLQQQRPYYSEDAITGVYSVTTHQPMLFFSSTGKVYKLKVWRLPLGNPQSKGKAFVNLLPLGGGETSSLSRPGNLERISTSTRGTHISPHAR